MEIRLLGPVAVWIAERRLDAGPPQQRLMLAALAADAGRLVLTETLIERIWGDRPPARPRAAIHANVTRIRGLLREANALTQERLPANLVHHGDGYVLQTDAVDLVRFRSLVSAPQQSTDAERVVLLQEALDLWRGPALADVSGDWPVRMREVWSLERLDTAVDWARTHLRLGHHAQVIGPVRALVSEYPLAEPLVAVLMQALAAVGRATEALDLYTALRQRLIEELGVEPRPELRELHRTILRGDVDRSKTPGTPYERVLTGQGEDRSLAVQQEVTPAQERLASPATQETDPRPQDEPPDSGRGQRMADRRLRPKVVLLISAAIVVILTGIGITILPGHGDGTSPPTSSPAHEAGSSTKHPNDSLPTGPYQIRSAASGLCLTEQPDSGTGRIYQTSCEHAFPTKTLQAQDDGTYRIKVVHPEFGPACMGIENARTTPGPYVFDDYCKEGGLAGAEYFHIQRVTQPNSGYLLKPAHNNLCLGFPNNSTENWAILNQLPCDDHALGQIFILDPT